MALPVIGSISTILLIGAALLIILWKKEFSGINQKLVIRIGISVLLIGAYNLVKIMVPIDSSFIPLVGVIELIGFSVLMFSLFNFLEASK